MFLKKIFRFFLSFFILILALFIGKLIAKLLPIGISESIWGLLLLFSALVFGLVKPEWIAPTARPLTRYMAVCFLPICVGLIEQKESIQQYFGSLFIATLLSTLLCIVLIGITAQRVFVRYDEKEGIK